MHEKPIAAGKSSFELIDKERLFAEIGLKSDTVLLDVACGAGKYSIAASEVLGNEGMIFAVDLWEEGIRTLKHTISDKGITNIKTFLADVSRHIPVEDQCIDIALMATVLHDLIEVHTEKGTLCETRRVLKPGGKLVIIEFKKIEGPPGPPLAIRLSPEETDRIVSVFGFLQEKVVEVGPYNYMSFFKSA